MAHDGWSEHRVPVGGSTVFYRRGDGPAERTPLVHVHGFGISGSYLLPTARRLTSHGVNIVPDLPGYGRSPRPPRTLGIPALADALAGMLDALELERVVLVGNSMGCPVVLEAARRAPERVAGLVLVSYWITAQHGEFGDRLPSALAAEQRRVRAALG